MSRTQGYAVQSFITTETLLGYYGKRLADLDEPLRARYIEYVRLANIAVSTFIYKYVDVLTLAPGSPEYNTAQNCALTYAQWRKAVDDGATFAGQFDSLYREGQKTLIELLKAKPEKVTTRRIVSRGYPIRGPRPYSQGYGVGRIL